MIYPFKKNIYSVYQTTSDKFTFKDKDGNKFRVDKNDSRLKSGELVRVSSKKFNKITINN